MTLPFLSSQDSDPLPVEVLPILYVVNFANELMHQRLIGVEFLKRRANKALQVVIRLLNLADVCCLELYTGSFRSDFSNSGRLRDIHGLNLPRPST